jgi:hypothetical protein
MKWINAKERLPTIEGEYFTWTLYINDEGKPFWDKGSSFFTRFWKTTELTPTRRVEELTTEPSFHEYQATHEFYWLEIEPGDFNPEQLGVSLTTASCEDSLS